VKTYTQGQFGELAGLQRPVHVAIGIFDGVHLGHQAVIQSAIRAASLDGGVSAVLTFVPHPSHLFRPENPTRLIYSSATKEEALRDLGVDLFLEKRFEPEFAKLTAADFTDWLRTTLPRLASVSVGENFRFGKGRVGSPSLLVQRLKDHGVSVYSCERLHLNGEAISSTRIRNLLPQEPIETVNTFLGQPYRTVGVVREGKRMGRTIGFPTMNVPVETEILPVKGVYVARFRKLSPSAGATHPAVTNFGIRPTVESTENPLLEVHALDEGVADYGDTLLVEWIRLLREEKKFSGVDELRAAISKDRQNALRFFG